MISIKTRIVLFLSIVILSAPFSISGQVQVVKSIDKVIISGKQYFIHQAKKGETLYSLSKAYNVTVDVITFENPETITGLREGQILKIPVVEIREPVRVRDENNFIYHELKKGETIFSLSRRYNVDQTAIITANPGIDINDLPINTVLAIPRVPFRVEQEEFRQQDENFLYHKVEKGETLSSISRLYKVPLKELKSANRMMLFPRIGDVVKVPVAMAVLPEAVAVISDSVVVMAEVLPEIVEVAAEITEIEKLKGTIDVALLLPFFIKENSARSYIDSTQIDAKGKKIFKTVHRPATWVFEPGVVFLEFYQGMILAVKDLRAKGLNINLYVYDTGADQNLVTGLINNGSLEGMDMIIGPVYSHNIELVAPWASARSIPMVIPFPTRTAPYLTGNPNIFRVQPSLEAASLAVAEATASFPDHNIVLIFSDLNEGRPLSSSLKRDVIRELSEANPLNEINIKEVAYMSSTSFSNDSVRRIEQSLMPGKPNLVIIGTEDPPVMSSVMARLHTLSRNYEIKVIGMPALRWLDNLEPRYFYDLEVIVGTNNWIDYSRENVKSYIVDYRSMYGTEPTDERSYAFQGYDISFYFLSGLAMEGRRFFRRVDGHNPELLVSSYRFVRSSDLDGFENRKLYLMQYKKDTRITLFSPPLKTPAAFE